MIRITHNHASHLVAVLLVITAVSLTNGCDIQEMLGLNDDSGSDTTVITDPAAVAGMEIVGGLIDTILEGGGDPPAGDTFPDYSAGSYPAGLQITVSTLSDLSVSLQVTITDVAAEAENGDVPEDITFNGTVTVIFTVNADGNELTVEMDGTITAVGVDARFASMTITGAVAVIPYTADSLGSPTSVTGTLTVDGVDFDMALIDTSDDSGGTTTTDPTDAHYFLISYWEDGAVNRPQIVYSDTGGNGTYTPIELSGTGRLRAGAIDDSDRMVAVGENGLIFSSDDGETWTLRGSGVTTSQLYTVEWFNNVWIAAGYDVILRSTDGLTWSSVWTGTGVSLYAVMYDSSAGKWVAAGAPPHVLVVSTDTGLNWESEDADGSNRPENLIYELFATSDDTEWVALTGGGAFPTMGGILDGTDLNDDSDIDWVLNSEISGTTAISTSFFSSPAGAVRSGVYVAMASPSSDGTGVTTLVSIDDGDSWTAHDVPNVQGWPVDITANSNGFMGVTNQGGLVRGSADGSVWEVLDDDSWGTFGIIFRP